MIRMLQLGCCGGIRSERRLCEEVSLNIACRWFCRLDLTGAVPGHSPFCKNRHGRFRDSDLFRTLCEADVARCIAEGSGDVMDVPSTVAPLRHDGVSIFIE